MLGRYWIEEKSIVNRSACLRRGKKIERLKTKPQELVECLMLDDPTISLYDPEERKAWFELTEAGSGDGRYNDAKFCKNAARGLFTNEIDFDKEPESYESAKPAHFWGMELNTFGTLAEAHKLAMFKRLCKHQWWEARRLPPFAQRGPGGAHPNVPRE